MNNNLGRSDGSSSKLGPGTRSSICLHTALSSSESYRRREADKLFIRLKNGTRMKF